MFVAVSWFPGEPVAATGGDYIAGLGSGRSQAKAFNLSLSY